MFEIKVEGVSELLKNFDTFGKQLDELHKQAPEELVDWQRTDMRRKYPNITVSQDQDETTSETDIWPRSRNEQPGSGFRRPRRPALAAPKQYRAKGAGRAPPSTRPILRTELFTKLVDRMTRLLTEAMKWP
ncbi:hypothetical protein NLM33_18745 [Bradyrhizobium sp. CCGUVB1N3]|uniref:hypothetical protein n=1 Tax=Bradyrhizobium sp. CCGUVB1N3 TaxID=2949629 RepID=UPI0020B1B883|nr:hypothetical protein [Bradyrhizobium sp. CCGUVB1N3]MCP3471417.1 hypothetical protein [Bradyrhizobium sp. CCGUVB1N3]MCP3472357.1 hypothetical protein [Bradyrhizobium sp. CCGUVB1N3]